MKNKFQTLVCLCVTSSALAWSTVASAITITSSGVWTAGTTSSGAPTGLNTNILSWGEATSAAGPSNYEFTGASDIELDSAELADGVIFNLGTFTHHNSPIRPPLLTSANLGLTFNIDGATTQALDVAFLHDETPNSDVCTYAGSTICPDRVSLVLLDNTEKFIVGGNAYAFRVVGFAQNFGDPYDTDFITEENQDNTTLIFGELTQIPSVPEPATAMASVLLLGLGGMARRQYRIAQRQA